MTIEPIIAMKEMNDRAIMNGQAITIGQPIGQRFIGLTIRTTSIVTGIASRAHYVEADIQDQHFQTLVAKTNLLYHIVHLT